MRIKKVYVLLLAGLMVFGMNACKKQNGGNDTNAVKEDIQISSEELEQYKPYIELAEKLCVQMAGGDFKETYETFSETLSKQLNETSLKSSWDQTVATIGNYIGYSDSKVTTKDDFVIVTSRLEYEKKGLAVMFTFNKENQLEGLWITYSAIPEEVKITEKYKETAIKIGEYELDGMLTLPKEVENPPVVILVQGSGQSDMNETINENKPFQDIAYGLAEKGIASIRYNKRYYQFPEKAEANLTVSDEVLEDVAAAIEYAAQCGEVDQNKIIVVGHSLGGMLAPKIASDNDKVAAIVSMAGSPRNLADILYDQNVDALNASTLTEEEKNTQLASVKTAVDQIKALSSDEGEAILGVSPAYWYSLNQAVAENIVAELDIPMLFLQGSADFQVKVDTDFAEWKSILSGKVNCSFIEYENLNHLFMTSNGKTDITEYETKGTVNETVILDMAEWILNLK